MRIKLLQHRRDICLTLTTSTKSSHFVIRKLLCWRSNSINKNDRCYDNTGPYYWCYGSRNFCTNMLQARICLAVTESETLNALVNSSSFGTLASETQQVHPKSGKNVKEIGLQKFFFICHVYFDKLCYIHVHMALHVNPLFSMVSQILLHGSSADSIAINKH